MTLLRSLDVLAQDARYGWRMLRRAPVFSAVAVLSLAFGIGANTAIFGLIYGIMLEPLAVREPEDSCPSRALGISDEAPTSRSTNSVRCEARARRSS